MTPHECSEYIMSIHDEKELLDPRNYKKIRNGIGYLLIKSDRFEALSEGFEHTISSYSEINEALGYYVGKEHFISGLFRNQLEELEQYNCLKIDGLYYPYTIRRIYWAMEKVVNHDPNIKIRTFYKGYLNRADLFHVHHNQTNSIGKNAKRYLDAHYKDYESFRDKISVLKESREKPIVRELLHDFTYTIYMDSLNPDKRKDDWEMTGEWIVFQRLHNDIVNFLCLSTHNEGSGDGKVLFDRIKEYLI